MQFGTADTDTVEERVEQVFGGNTDRLLALIRGGFIVVCGNMCLFR